MKKVLPLLLLSCSFLVVFAPPVFADAVSDKAKMVQMTMQKINLNTATLAELTSLPGVGEKKAAAIVEYREKFGKFTTLEQLTEVKGIGPKMLEKLKDQITL